MKKYLSIFITAVFLVSLSIPVFASGSPAQKEEAVYSLLKSDGSILDIYVVNSFSGGKITDYGVYSAVSNLTSSENLKQNGDMISIETQAKRFYYQGTLEKKELPWNISVKYEIDGKELSAAELAGKSGALKIYIAVKQNTEINPVFYENYLLQISLALDTELCADIFAPNATIASAGKDKVIAYTAMPGNNTSFTVTANVHDFVMGGIEITAMPFAMLIEMPEIDNLIEDMGGLSDAVNELNDGVRELHDGISEINLGARKLADGSSDFANGLSQLGGNSDDLLGASAQIKSALDSIVKSLEGGGVNIDLGDIAELPGGLKKLSDGLLTISNGMEALKDGYTAAYNALDDAASSIPDADIDPSGLYAAIYGDDELTAALDGLVTYYGAAKKVKATYGAVREAFDSVAGSLDRLSGSVDKITKTLAGIADQIEHSLSNMDFAEKIQQLKSGLTQLSNNYTRFHTGLGNYTNGVKRLSNGYGEVYKGVKSLANGIGEINAGALSLHEGTEKLNDAVADLPNTMQNEIDEMLNQYKTSDFAPVSFVSDKNTNVAAVQFVLKTQPIEIIKPPLNSEPAPAKLTFWQKLLKLFGLYS